MLLLSLQSLFAALHFRPLPTSGPTTAEVVLGVLLIPSHLYFISCAVHADAIPGDRQYWLTRPFTRGQLLAAKLLLTLLIVHLPLFVSDCLILIGHRFNPLLHLPALLWRQILYFLAVSILMLALAAVTRNLSQLALAALVLAAAAIFVPALLPWFNWPWGGLAWIKIIANSLLACSGAAAVLYLLYLRRRVHAGWAVLATTALVFPFATELAPFAFAFRLQRQIHPSPNFHPIVKFVPERVRPAAGRSVNPKQLTLLLPISVENLPTNSGAHADRIQATLRLPNGESHSLQLRGSWSADRGAAGDWLFFPIDPALFAKLADRTVTIDVTLYMTTFGPHRSYVMPAKSPEPRPMAELGRCLSAPDLIGLVAVTCMAPVQLPSRITVQLVHPSGAQASREVRLNDGFNYSPFPADRFQLSPIASATGHFNVMNVPGRHPSTNIQAQILASNLHFHLRDPQSHFTASLKVPPTLLRDLVY
ncbi:MAG: hypothetical protein JNK48_05805 [Bryobacterales bacterium]|nr:hypothetical protein [Bryobacterales bacterium]